MTTGLKQFNDAYGYEARVEQFRNHMSRLISKLQGKNIRRESEVYEAVTASDFRDFKHAPQGGNGQTYIFRKKDGHPNLSSCSVAAEFLNTRAYMLKMANIRPDVTEPAIELENKRQADIKAGQAYERDEALRKYALAV